MGVDANSAQKQQKVVINFKKDLSNMWRYSNH